MRRQSNTHGMAAVRGERAHNPRILVDEDDADIRFIASTLLVASGYDVDEAGDGAVALEKLHSARFDLMLLDLMMPRVDGFQVLERMSAEIRSTMPVLVLTASARNQARFTTLTNERTLCMTKPFNNAELLSAICRLLGGRPDPHADEPSDSP